jgi:hypothetical protein
MQGCHGWTSVMLSSAICPDLFAADIKIFMLPPYNFQQGKRRELTEDEVILFGFL